MRLFIRCPFCHRSVLGLLYGFHQRRHTERGSDGQMRDHITVAPSERHSGSLAGVPRTYLHAACGVETTMPEEIVRSYLANPFLYSERSFCCGCEDYVDTRALRWVGTGESLFRYMQRLQQEYVRVHGAPPRRRRS